jgi:carboxyl-terminal processing protease
VIVGERTWGKGTVQDLIDLEGNRGAIRLTTATYWRPSEKDINRDETEEDGDWGVSPNEGYELKLDDEERARFQRWRRNRDVYRPIDNGEGPNGDPSEPFVDRQLAKALEYIGSAVRGGP